MLIEKLQQIKEQLQQDKKIVEGTVKAHKKGFGFLEVKKAKQAYFIAPYFMKKLMHGDKIRATINVINGKEQIEPNQLIKSFLQNKFIARVFLSKNSHDKTIVKLKIEHDDINILIAARVNTKLNLSLQQDDFVIATLVAHPLREQTNFIANIESFICNAQDNYAPWLVAFAKYNFRYQTDNNLITNNTLSYDFIESHPREDLTNLDFFTIDSINSRDLDDAIYIQSITENDILVGWKLYVAIADPTAFIEYNSEIDLICREKLTSSYFYNFNFPMLPRIFSENTCSLLPDQKKPAVVCKIDLDSTGEVITDPIFSLAWIQSKEKLDYAGVHNFIAKTFDLEDGDELDEKYSNLTESLKQQLADLYEFYLARIACRRQDNYSTQNEYEYNFVVDKGKLMDVHFKKIKISHKMIEEVMVLSNICCAKFFVKNSVNAIFSTNTGFQTKFTKLIKHFLSEYNNIDTKNFSNLEEYKKLWQQIYKLGDDTRSATDKKYIEMRLKKFMAPTSFTLTSEPHFGLAVDEYATWTSPIRKYGDMINHRIIKDIILNNPCNLDYVNNELLSDLLKNRKQNKNIELEINNWLYINYIQENFMKDEIIFDATITDINSIFIKAELNVCGASVNIVIKSLINTKDTFDKYHIDYNKIILYINDQKIYRLADAIKLKITSINFCTKQLFGAICNKD